MGAFDLAANALFADANLAVIAIFAPQAGGSNTVRVITRAPDSLQDAGSMVVETPTLTLEVRLSDCSVIVAGDRFTINSVTYTVQGAPRRDDLQLIWQVDVYAS